jgi:hypothetical protein
VEERGGVGGGVRRMRRMSMGAEIEQPPFSASVSAVGWSSTQPRESLRMS